MDVSSFAEHSVEGSVAAAPLILTLKLDKRTFDVMNGLRQQHFPPERNFLPAHITLFHALPGEAERAIREHLNVFCRQTPAPLLLFSKLRFLGRGVAIEVDSPELNRLRKQLAAVWSAWLSAQDQQGYRPHVTLQNKTTSEEARRLYEALNAVWPQLEGRGEGLLLWRYLGGPWELVEEFAFV